MLCGVPWRTQQNVRQKNSKKFEHMYVVWFGNDTVSAIRFQMFYYCGKVSRWQGRLAALMHAFQDK
jgi:hypothetical protein